MGLCSRPGAGAAGVAAALLLLAGGAATAETQSPSACYGSTGDCGGYAEVPAKPLRIRLNSHLFLGPSDGALEGFRGVRLFCPLEVGPAHVHLQGRLGLQGGRGGVGAGGYLTLYYAF